MADIPPESKTPSSEQSREAFGVTLLNANHPAMRKVKKDSDQPSIHGTKFWGSSYVLMDYLLKNPMAEGTRILELGCGWGALSIFCAKQFGAEPIGIDADPAVFPYLDLHAEYNGVQVERHAMYFEDLGEQHFEGIDVVIGADICFWDELADTLIEVVDCALDAGVAQVLIADPERSPFFVLAEHCIEAHCAELIPHSVDQPRRSSGCILNIENA